MYSNGPTHRIHKYIVPSYIDINTDPKEEYAILTNGIPIENNCRLWVVLTRDPRTSGRVPIWNSTQDMISESDCSNYNFQREQIKCHVFQKNVRKAIFSGDNFYIQITEVDILGQLLVLRGFPGEIGCNCSHLENWGEKAFQSSLQPASIAGAEFLAPAEAAGEWAAAVMAASAEAAANSSNSCRTWLKMRRQPGRKHGSSRSRAYSHSKIKLE